MSFGHILYKHTFGIHNILSNTIKKKNTTNWVMFSEMAMKAYKIIYNANISSFIEENTTFFCYFCYFLPQKTTFTFKHLNTVKTYF